MTYKEMTARERRVRTFFKSRLTNDNKKLSMLEISLTNLENLRAEKTAIYHNQREDLHSQIHRLDASHQNDCVSWRSTETALKAAIQSQKKDNQEVARFLASEMTDIEDPHKLYSLRQACVLANDLTHTTRFKYNTIKDNPHMQPKGGLEDETKGGAKCWYMPSILEWKDVTKATRADYNLKYPPIEKSKEPGRKKLTAKKAVKNGLKYNTKKKRAVPTSNSKAS